jgi:maltooligosyltrehalose trehalohydrolase
VHGPSCWVDHGEFAWTDRAWHPPSLSSAVFYELHIGTFTPGGTFESTIGKLDHLVSLGVTHVEVMPVGEYSGLRGWGYDGVDLFAPHHAYGGAAGLKQLVDACHARGLAVILDVVYNHLGPSGNYLGRFGPYFTEHYRTPWGSAINFDGPDSDEVRRFCCDNAVMWLRDYHFDGLRLDAVHAILDGSPLTFVEQLGKEVRQLAEDAGRPYLLIAENDRNDPRLLRSKTSGGFQLDAQWNDDFHHALHSVLTGESSGYYADFGALADLAKAFRQGYVYDGCYSRYRRRHQGRAPSGLNGHQFVVCLQNHDQIGNRATGERSSRLMSMGRLKIGAALVLASPFLPLLFQGEEWGASTPFLYFTDHQDPKLAAAVREGRRREFQMEGLKPQEIPDPQAIETFTRSKLNWDELAKAPHAELLAWHRELIRLRRAEPGLTDPDLSKVGTRYDELQRWLVVERGPIAIVCNLATREQVIPLLGNYRTLASSDSEIRLASGGLGMPPESVAIMSRTAQITA